MPQVPAQHSDHQQPAANGGWLGHTGREHFVKIRGAEFGLRRGSVAREHDVAQVARLRPVEDQFVRSAGRATVVQVVVDRQDGRVGREAGEGDHAILAIEIEHVVHRTARERQRADPRRRRATLAVAVDAERRRRGARAA